MVKLKEHKHYNSRKYDYESQKTQVLLFLVFTVPLISAGLFFSLMAFFDLSSLQALWIVVAYLLLLGGYAFLNRKRSGVVLVILDFLNRRRLKKQGTNGLVDQ